MPWPLAADGGASILIAEQKTDLLAAICERVVVIADGAVALDGPAAEVLADPRLEELGVAAPAGVRLSRAAEPPACRRRAGQRLRQAVAGDDRSTAPSCGWNRSSHVYPEGGCVPWTRCR